MAAAESGMALGGSLKTTTTVSTGAFVIDVPASVVAESTVRSDVTESVVGGRDDVCSGRR